jgi:hypothetical protein
MFGCCIATEAIVSSIVPASLSDTVTIETNGAIGYLVLEMTHRVDRIHLGDELVSPRNKPIPSK